MVVFVKEEIMALNIDRATTIAESLAGKDSATVATLSAALAHAATNDPISVAILAEIAPGLDLATDTDNVKAAVAFFSLPNALTVVQLRAAFGLIATLPKAV